MRPIYRLILVAALYGMGWGSVHARDANPAKGDVAHFQIHSQPVEIPQKKFVDKDGKELILADFKGKVLLLNFWASWCSPCRAEMPSINDLQAELGGDQFEVVAISVDNGGIPQAQKFLDETNSDKLKLYSDRSSKFFRAMGGRGLPLTVLVTADGLEAGRVFGPVEWNSDDAINLIRHYFPDEVLPGDPVIQTNAAHLPGNEG